MRLLAIGIVLFCASAQNAPTGQEGYVEHTLTMNVPGKVALVQWRIQSDLCRVQIGFPAVQDDQKQPTHAQTQVWVLKADGTAISQTGKPSTIGWQPVKTALWHGYSGLDLAQRRNGTTSERKALECQRRQCRGDGHDELSF